MNITKIKDGNYVTIQGWMINNLHLKGNELIVYAIIYMFSQTNEQKYTGSLQYLSSWLSMSKQGTQKILKSLMQKNLIKKNEIFNNNVKFCEYSTIQVDGVCNYSLRGMQPELTNIKEEINKRNIKESFDKFWDAYPKKISKGNAEKWFEKNKPNEELVNKMIDKINLLKETEQWKSNNGQYIPYPASWLNSKGWEDEIKISIKPVIEKRIF